MDKKARIREYKETARPMGQPDDDPSEDLRLLVEMWREKLLLADGPGYGSESKPGR